MVLWSIAQARFSLASALLIALMSMIILDAVGMPMIVTLLLGTGIVVMVYRILMRRYRQRLKVARGEFPAHFRRILEEEISFYRSLSAEERRRFEQFALVFLAEHQISGVSQVAIEERTRLLIAAGAITLLFHRPEWDYTTLREILVYDDAFDQETFATGRSERTLGLAGQQIPIILSRKHLDQGFRHSGDGFNLVYHEFAHIIDLHDVGSHSNPLHGMFAQNLMQREMARASWGSSVLRDYAATNEAEFFAVATEFFFEKPDVLAEHHPDIYATLSRIYAWDPLKTGDD